jgi:hypothetical protein
MSQKTCTYLKQQILLYVLTPLICSGFDNECSNNFPTLLIKKKVSYINEKNSFLEHFTTRVFILPKNTDRFNRKKTIKHQSVNINRESFLEDQTNSPIMLRWTSSFW